MGLYKQCLNNFIACFKYNHDKLNNNRQLSIFVIVNCILE